MTKNLVISKKSSNFAAKSVNTVWNTVVNTAKNKPKEWLFI